MSNAEDWVTKEMVDTASADHVTTERVYDIVRDQFAAIGEKARLLAAQQQVNASRASQTQGFGGLVAPPPVCDIDPAHTEARHWYLDKCINVLQESNRIRSDEVLMKEIRAFIRQKRDEAADLLDKIG